MLAGAVNVSNLSVFFFLQVIGRGGEQISRIQQESGCKIQIAPGNYLWEGGCLFGENGGVVCRKSRRLLIASHCLKLL